MDVNRRRRGVDGDDSLLASVAGVPLTRMARVALCLVWAGFWSARVALTDTIPYFQGLQLKPATAELLGPGPVDQAFSICMIWLSVEVAVIAWTALKAGGKMLIAKTTPSFKQQLIRELTKDMSVEDLETLIERKREKERLKNEAKGKRGKE